MISQLLCFFYVGYFFSSATLMGMETPVKSSPKRAATSQAIDVSPIQYGSPSASAFKGMNISSPAAAPYSPVSRDISPRRLYTSSSISGSNESSMTDSSMTDSSIMSPFGYSLNSSTSSINESPARKILRLSSKGKKITSGDVAQVKYNFARMQDDTPLKSKKRCAQEVAFNMNDSLKTSPTVDKRKKSKRPPLGSSYSQNVRDNDQALEILRSVAGNKSKERRLQTLAIAAKQSEELKRSLTVVDTHHCMIPEFKSKSVSGGHDEDSYNKKDLDRVFFEDKDKTRKILSARGSLKTTEKGFDHERIIDVKENAIVVAKNNSGSFEVLQTPDGKYYGSHPDLSNPLVINSIFPIVVAQNQSTSPSKPVFIGSIQTTSPEKSSIISRQSIAPSQVEFRSIVDSGDRLISEPGAPVDVIDISKPLSDHYAPYFNSVGISQNLPVFAVISKK